MGKFTSLSGLGYYLLAVFSESFCTKYIFNVITHKFVEEIQILCPNITRILKSPTTFSLQLYLIHPS